MTTTTIKYINSNDNNSNNKIYLFSVKHKNILLFNLLETIFDP